MEFDLSKLNLASINSASTLEKLSRLQEESLHAVAQANKEKNESEQRMVAGAEASSA